MAKEIELGKGFQAVVDDVDHDWLVQWKWRTSSGPIGKRYAIRTETVNKRTRALFMHREVALWAGMRPGNGEVIDHINRDRLDNRRSNLRIATPSQNAQNSTPANGRLKGVYPSNWQAYVTAGGEQYRAVVKTREAAVIVRDIMALDGHGEFAVTNVLPTLLEFEANNASIEKALSALRELYEKLSDDKARTLASSEDRLRSPASK